MTQGIFPSDLPSVPLVDALLALVTPTAGVTDLAQIPVAALSQQVAGQLATGSVGGQSYPTVGAGLAATAEGGYFNVPGGSGAGSIVTYRVVSGAAVAVAETAAAAVLAAEIAARTTAGTIEAGLRAAADTALTEALNAEIAARTTAGTTEAGLRADGDAALTETLNAEITARKVADVAAVVQAADDLGLMGREWISQYLKDTGAGGSYAGYDARDDVAWLPWEGDPSTARPASPQEFFAAYSGATEGITLRQDGYGVVNQDVARLGVRADHADGARRVIIERLVSNKALPQKNNIADLTGITKQASLSASVVDASSMISDAGMDYVFPSGKLFMLVNATGGNLTCTFYGAVGATTPHYVSFYACGSGTIRAEMSSGSPTFRPVVLTDKLTLYKLGPVTPTSSAHSLRFTVYANTTVYLGAVGLYEGGQPIYPVIGGDGVITKPAETLRVPQIAMRGLTRTVAWHGSVYNAAAGQRIIGTADDQVIGVSSADATSVSVGPADSPLEAAAPGVARSPFGVAVAFGDTRAVAVNGADTAADAGGAPPMSALYVAGDGSDGPRPWMRLDRIALWRTALSGDSLREASVNDTDERSFFRRAGPLPSNVTAAVTKFVRRLKAGDCWSVWDQMHILALPTERAACANMVQAAGDLQVIGSPSYTPYVGYEGDTSNYLQTEASYHCTRSTLTSTSAFVFCLDDSASANRDLLLGNTQINTRYTGDGMFNSRANSGATSVTSAENQDPILMGVSRLNSANYDVIIDTRRVTVASPANGDRLAGGSETFRIAQSARPLPFVCFGAGVTDAQTRVLNNALIELLVELGTIIDYTWNTSFRGTDLPTLSAATVVFNDDFDSSIDAGIDITSTGSGLVKTTPTAGHKWYAPGRYQVVGAGIHQPIGNGTILQSGSDLILRCYHNGTRWVSAHMQTYSSQGRLLDGTEVAGLGTSFHRGYCEAKIKMPSGLPAKSWPAFWMHSVSAVPYGSGQEYCEMDHTELYSEDGARYVSVIHRVGSAVPNGRITRAIRWRADSTLFDDTYHLWGWEVTDTHIITYLDRKEVGRVKMFDVARDERWWIDISHQLSGTPASTSSVYNMYVDYVRVWER